MTTRQLVYSALMRVLNDGAYSNIAIDKAIKAGGLEKPAAAFSTALFYGVLENAIRLDYTLSHYVKKGLSSIDKQVLIILRMGLYQLCMMDSVPDNAAVDECVNLVAYARKASAKGFVNAVMRGFIRDGKQLLTPPEGDPLHYSVKYACPQWLFDLWTSQYDLETAVEFAKSSMEIPPITARVNTLKTTAEKLIGYLENRGVHAVKHDSLEDCLVLSHTGSIDRLPQYKQGLFHIQDVASQVCSRALNAAPDHTVLDICSAPGSKAFTIAQYMQNEGKLYAFDMFEHKLKLIKDGAKRLGITIISPEMQDGAVFNPDIPLADRVMCDVPCSGLGIIRRKPEIKFKAQDSFSGLPDLQLGILKNAASYVKIGGYLIYSTCTTNKLENEAVIAKFVHKNNSFKPLQLSKILDTINIGDENAHFVTLMPHIHGCDGFFIAAFERTEG